LILTSAQPAAHHEILPGQPAKALANRPQHALVVGVHTKPGADAGTRW
jgi:hypothetical protein